MPKKIWVYIAGPYTGGDVVVNVCNAIKAGLELRQASDERVVFVPVIPHLSHFIHMVEHHDYRFWMAWDADWLERCDAIVRLPGESPGSEEGVEQAQRQRARVFTSVRSCIFYYCRHTRDEND